MCWVLGDLGSLVHYVYTRAWQCKGDDKTTEKNLSPWILRYLEAQASGSSMIASTSIIRAVSLSANDRIMMNLYFEQANGLA